MRPAQAGRIVVFPQSAALANGLHRQQGEAMPARCSLSGHLRLVTDACGNDPPMAGG
jgi:hypothetical protein